MRREDVLLYEGLQSAPSLKKRGKDPDYPTLTPKGCIRDQICCSLHCLHNTA